MLVHADAKMYAGLFDGDEAAKLKSENQLQLAHGQSAEVLVFDLAP